MKKHLLTVLLLVACIAGLFAAADSSSQKKKMHFGDGFYLRDSSWHIGGYAGFTLSQVALVNWGPGGSDNIAFLLNGNAYANYKKGKWLWENNLDMKWGMIANGVIDNANLAARNFQKNIDILSFNTNAGYKIKDELYFSFKASFLSQFSPSYDYSLTDTTNGRFRKYKVSQFFAPAILTIGPGLTYIPKPYLTIFVSPIEGKMTFVEGQGKDTAHVNGDLTNGYYDGIDPTRYGLRAGSHFGAALGAELDILFQKDLVKNINWKSHLNVFESYANNNYNTIMPGFDAADDSVISKTISMKSQHIPIVRWDNDFVFKVNKWLSATLSARFVYKYNDIVAVEDNGATVLDKHNVPLTTYNRIQIFEQFGLALNYKF